MAEPVRSVRVRWTLRVLLLASLAASFAWGFATDRLKIFPMPLLRRAARLGGIGGWQKPADAESRSPSLMALKSIPYLTGRQDAHAEVRNVSLSLPGRVTPGVNFYSTLAGGRAFLIGIDGAVRWSWTITPSFDGYELKGVDVGYPHVYANGDVLAYVADRALVKLDRESHLLWRRTGRFHHDAWVCPDGTIYALTRGSKTVSSIENRLPSLLDTITVLSADGTTQREVSLLEVLERSPYAFLLPRTAGLALPNDTDSIDVLHANHIEVCDGSLAARSPLYRRGNLLVSLRNINTVMIIDGQSLRVLWLWGPTNLTLQHHPTLLENGHVLLFDNGTSQSAILEIDPLTNRIVWRYAPDHDFYSSIQGAVQRLPSGNTLITVSQGGYAIEVTPEGETTWKFSNPIVHAGGVREGIYRVIRHQEQDLAFLQHRAAAPTE